MPIIKLEALEIYDSRGNPTVEVDLYTDKGMFTAMVPSGASTGIYEAVELRDDDKSKHCGKGVHKACENVNKIIAPKLIQEKVDVCDQKRIDEIMIKLDGTPNKAKLGANAILGVSMACAKAGAAERGVPLYKYLANLAHSQKIILPIPSFNVINGGKHSGNQLAMQEFMILPVGAANFAEAMRMGSETYHVLKKILVEKFGLDSTGVGDEGGFAPELSDIEEVLKLLTMAIDKAGYNGKIKIGMDPASSEFYKDGKYNLRFKDPKHDQSHILTGDQLGDLYMNMVQKYPIIFIEDPFEQDDWANWAKFYKIIGDKLTIVGDDLTVTNPKRIKEAIEKKACNCLLLKVNQIGTLTEALDACELAYNNGWTVLVSHRSGETEDSFIADLVVGIGAGKIKTGAPCRSERLAKYNRLIHIERELGENADYAGKHFNEYFSTKVNM